LPKQKTGVTFVAENNLHTMKHETKQQARELFLKTEMTKSEIAAQLHITRRTLQLWIKNDQWDTLKQYTRQLEAMMAENSYRLIAQFTDHIVSRGIEKQAITRHDVEALRKAVQAVGKLQRGVAI
jgi:uncharacterized protein YjcR